jgi:DNA-binding MarR family transcriptional regulator
VVEIRLIELLNSIQRQIVKRLAPLVQAEGLSLTEALVLWKLHRRGSCRVTDLATEIGLPPSTLTGVLDRLADGGWLKREPDPGDRRGVVLKSSRKLGDFVQRTLRAGSRSLEKSFKVLPPETLRQLDDGLTALLDCLERDEETRR